MVELFIALVFILSAGLTALVRRDALNRSLIDIPNQRSSHQVPTPRGGGLAVVVAFLAGIIAFAWFGTVPGDLFIALLGSGSMVAVIGYWDDHGHIPARWRIAVHSAAALWSVGWLGGLSPIPLIGFNWLPGWFGYPLAVILLVWLLNLFNFMDGIDGFAAAETLFVALAAGGLLLAVGQPTVAAMLTLFAAAVGGFLLWNWPPAKIFMGDVGSGFLGITFGTFLLATLSSGLNLWVWLILMALFIVDATVTLLRRMVAGERWYEAHCSHAYQHLARRWQSHRRVTVWLCMVNLLWLLPLAAAALRWPSVALSFALIAYAPLVIMVWRLGAGRADG